MKASQLFITTQKNPPSDADIISNQLMVQAGLVKKLASGLYAWLPMGLRVLRKVETIIREEMDAIGSQELLMTMVQPAELWQESGRFGDYGAELLRFQDRHLRDFVLGPTHEEVITDIARGELASYKQLPVCFYQIQTKFRDEIRPRFGVMRAREFTMKDAYSFHIDKSSLATTYEAMFGAYCRIFSRLGLDFRAVAADTGAIGGFASHEFQVLADSGEDSIVFCNQSDYAANIELAEAITNAVRPAPTQNKAIVDTPDMPTCQAVAEHLGISLTNTVKTLIVEGIDSNGEDSPVALVLRGDHNLNTLKAEKLPQIKTPLTLTSEQTLEAYGLVKGYIGVFDLGIPIIVDRSVAVMADFVCGGNKKDTHATGINWERDAQFDAIADLRNVVVGDPSPDGKGQLQIRRGIEVGHIFQLGDKYSKALNCQVLGKDGKPVTLMMGCYGIGVSRIIAAAIEQSHDERGIIWPVGNQGESIAPFFVVVIPMYSKDGTSETAAETLYHTLKQRGLEVLLDDRDERAGVKFADMELLGVLHRVVVSSRHLPNEQYEYKPRNAESELVTLETLMEKLGCS